MSDILRISPKISEKSYLKSQTENIYVFTVPMSANKLQIAAAVGSQYGVTVENVRTVIAKGKTKRTALKRRQPRTGTRKNVKKAYVSLKKGDTITIFETEGEA